MNSPQITMKLVVLGLSLSSSWGNGHATTYRALLREFAKLGHEILFLERDVPWYRDNRDLPAPDFCRLEFYADLADLKARFEAELRACDWAIVGSYVPQGVEVGNWATKTAPRVAFYDIDTPVTLAKLARGDFEYLSPELIARYDLYLSFSGGPTLERLEKMGSPRARALFCSVDPALYFPETIEKKWDLTYLGTYSDDRQPTLETLLIEVARQQPQLRFCVAGPQYPPGIAWPENVERIEHLPPAQHRAFYNASRWTLNVTRADMIEAGHSPSVRLFEAAACGVPILSDFWPGLDEIFEFDSEIRIAASTGEAIRILADNEASRRAIGEAARARVLGAHTAAHRARELHGFLAEV
ncbi:MAG TPA: glycosyltransferase [Abditibacterium sp.]|jgi:spore maturation protein CgeB